MKAVLNTAKEVIEVREVDDPKPAPGEVLVRVRACGICGSDLHFYHGAFPAAPNVPPGHEYAGEIAAVGEGVSGFEVGERVAVEPIRYCRECAYCTTGQYQLCPNRVLMGTYAPGAMAEYVPVPAYGVYRMPDSLDFELGALAEPLAVAVHGLHLVDTAMGETVLIMGSGTIGLMAVLAARALGAGEIIVTYRHEHQGQAALAAGATKILKDSDMGRLEGIDVVVETVGGSAPTLSQALGIVRPGGRVSVLGLFTQPSQVNALGLMLKEIRIVGGITYCRPGLQSDFDAALRILDAEQERARGIITHRYSLDDAVEAFRVASDKSSGSIKVQLHP
jgi:2-desacetyl-2-hydroxyethyl bacteriochlorophyllide A dehydrogenase